eukprot:930736-Pleurochrysis_carterae.AAC.1
MRARKRTPAGCALSAPLGPRPNSTWAEQHLGVDDARMHTALMYTDDIVLAVVGTHRTVTLLRAWHRVTRNVGLTMAMPEKKQAGT